MPNWCFNEVDIYAEPDTLKRIKELLKGEGSFDFNRILPMPEELACLHSGGRDLEVNGELRRVKVWREAADGNAFPVDEADLLERFGASNWYDWALQNWGTKWNVTGDVLVDETEDSLRYEFDTAWGPPEGVCSKLCELFPEASISWFYREDGEQIAGWL